MSCKFPFSLLFCSTQFSRKSISLGLFRFLFSEDSGPSPRCRPSLTREIPELIPRCPRQPADEFRWLKSPAGLISHSQRMAGLVRTMIRSIPSPCAPAGTRNARKTRNPRGPRGGPLVAVTPNRRPMSFSGTGEESVATQSDERRNVERSAFLPDVPLCEVDVQLSFDSLALPVSDESAASSALR